MITPVYITEEIKAVAAAVQTALAARSDIGIPNVYYMHGHPLEIVKRLQDKLSAPTQKDKRFPVIILLQDFRERRGRSSHVYAEPALNIVVATATKPEYTSEQRYEKTFKPVLYPIYYELMEQLALSDMFSPSNAHEIEHTKWDRLYWGRQGLYGSQSNMFNDYIDAIEIEDLQPQVSYKQCKPIH